MKKNDSQYQYDSPSLAIQPVDLLGIRTNMIYDANPPLQADEPIIVIKPDEPEAGKKKTD